MRFGFDDLSRFKNCSVKELIHWRPPKRNCIIIIDDSYFKDELWSCMSKEAAWKQSLITLFNKLNINSPEIYLVGSISAKPMPTARNPLEKGVIMMDTFSCATLICESVVEQHIKQLFSFKRLVSVGYDHHARSTFIEAKANEFLTQGKKVIIVSDNGELYFMPRIGTFR